MDQFRSRRKLQLLVFLIDYVCEIRSISSSITLRRNVERLRGVFRKFIEEQFKEGVNILAGNRASVHSRSIVGIGVTNVDRLVEENHVGMGIPAERIVSCVLAFISDTTGSKFEQKASRGAATWAPIQP
jgi:hypothetical protein